MPDLNFWLLIIIIILSIGFGTVNGFNDAANAIAPAIGTRALSPRKALIIAVIANMAGACTGILVARTIGKGILIPEAITYETIIAALVAVIIWGVVATRLGLPISLHHGFIAGLAGAGFAVSGSKAVVWPVMGKVLSAVGIAPLLGFAGAFLLTVIIYWLCRRSAPDTMRVVFSRLQYFTTAFMAYSHGKNDGQMPIGVITMATVIYYQDPGIWDRLSISNSGTWWIIVVSALAISFGTATGGWRVIRTMGLKMTTLRPMQGFAATAAAATIIESASHLGIPVSTTHCITASVMGVGAVTRFSAVRWMLAENVVIAWIATFPICGVIGYAITLLLRPLF
jgi:PiT family inorganic phosphate transporter